MPEYRVLVTGSRDWDKPDVVEGALDLALQAMHNVNLERLGESTHDDPARMFTFTLVHGACPTGADKQADDWAAKHPEVRVERHPAQWNQFGASAGPRRNAEMVSRGAVVVLAFPRGASRGTRGTIKMAREAGLLVYETDDKSVL